MYHPNHPLSAIPHVGGNDPEYSGPIFSGSANGTMQGLLTQAFDHTSELTDDMIVVFVASRGSAYPSGIEYEGSNFTKIKDSTGFTLIGIRTSVWILQGPHEGTFPINITYSIAPLQTIAFAIALKDVKQEDPVGVVAIGNSSGSSLSVNPVSTVNQMVIGMAGKFEAVLEPIFNPGPGETLIGPTVTLVTVQANMSWKYGSYPLTSISREFLTANCILMGVAVKGV